MAESVSKVIKEWHPGVLATELKYRDSLTALLHERLGKARIETEYRHLGTTVDIYVNEPGFLSSTETFIELKRNLTQKAQLDRLVGQIESLRPGKNRIVIVLCGASNPALVSRLREKYKSEAWTLYEEADPMLNIVVKEPQKG